METTLLSRPSHSRSPESNSASDPQPLTILSFGRERYRLASPQFDWRQESPDTAAFCSRCGATLTFCFSALIDPLVSGLAATSIYPVAVRCDCFLTEEGGIRNSFSPSNKLARPPIAIMPEMKPDNYYLSARKVAL